MTATTIPAGKLTFVNRDGGPLAGGRVYFYVPATTTPKNTWQDEAQTTLNTNPVVLDAYGSALVYGVGDYRQVLRDADGNLIWDLEVSARQTLSDVQENPFITVTPVPDEINTLASLVVEGATTTNTTREYLGVFSFTNTHGRGEAIPPNYGGDKAALFAGVNATTNQAGNNFAFIASAQLSSGTGSDYQTICLQAKINNLQGDRLFAAIGPSVAGAYGIFVLGGGAYVSTAGVVVTGPDSPVWETGLLMTGNNIQKYGIWDQTQSIATLYVTGSHTVALDTSDATLTGGIIRGAQTQWLQWESATPGTFVNCVALDGAVLRLGPVTPVAGLTSIAAGVDMTPATAGGSSLGTTALRWGTVRAATLNLTANLQFRKTAGSPDTNVDTLVYDGGSNSLFIGSNSGPSANLTNIYSSATFLPYNTTVELGASGQRWNAFWGLNANFAGDVSVTGYVIDGTVRMLSYNGTHIVLGETSQAGVSAIFASHTLVPTVDATFRCGDSTTRWLECWASNGFFQTSDLRDKQDILPVRKGALALVREVMPVTFRWKDTERQGEETHFGYVAQDLDHLMREHGYPTEGIINATGPRLALSMTEIIPLLHKAVQELADKVDVLEKRRTSWF